jgi:hypothetical protein
VVVAAVEAAAGAEEEAKAVAREVAVEDVGAAWAKAP